MKIAIIHTTLHDTTEKAAKYITSKFNGDVDLIQLDENTNVSIDKYQKIILGTHVDIGIVSPEMRKFCKNNIDHLKTKEIGLFACGLEPDFNKQQYELEIAYPKLLLTTAKAKVYVFADLSFKLNNFLYNNNISKFIFGKKTDANDYKHDMLDQFIEKMK